MAMPFGMAAQTADDNPPPRDGLYSGCVTQIPDTQTYVLATADACILLQGDFDAQKVTNHVSTLKGVLSEGHRKRLEVHSIEKMGDACTQTCKLPPMTRGLHGKELPGSNGGTAGEKPNTQPQLQ
jgi:hypothetical protein